MGRFLKALVVTTLVASAAAFATAPTAGAKKVRPGEGDITKINHVVVLMQENRSYDHYFGLLHEEGQKAASKEPKKGNPNPLNPSQRIRPFIQPNTCEVGDLDHGWDATHREIDGGKMDGFTAENAIPADPTGSRAMGRYDAGQLPFYYTLAYEFAVADRYFASVPGPTFPNRFYLLTGTSFGQTSNNITVYDQKTIFQSLDEAQPPVSWKIYFANVQVELLFRYVAEHSAGHVFPISQYYKDAANGTLPQVSFVESDGITGENTQTDEHPPANEQLGQRFTHDVVKALAESPNWTSSAFFLAYDEHGGYYDHVKPPKAVPPDDIPPIGHPGEAFDQYGVRVPALVVSPWAKPHHVSHVVYDHTSILKFIETRFGLPPLTRRDAAADPMLDMFDFSEMSLPHANLPDAPIDPAGVAQCHSLYP